MIVENEEKAIYLENSNFIPECCIMPSKKKHAFSYFVFGLTMSVEETMDRQVWIENHNNKLRIILGKLAQALLKERT